MPTRPVLILVTSFLLACLSAACQPLPVETPPDAPVPAERVAIASPSPESAEAPAPVLRPRPPLSATLQTGEPSVLELVPLGLGASWVYSVTLDMPGEQGSLHWSATLTETITEVRRVQDAWVYRSETTGQLPSESPPHEPVQIYVPLGGRLYQLSESLDPLAMIEAGGQGFEGERIVTWPLVVGQTWTDPNLGAEGGPPYYWRVESEEELRTAAGTLTGCYRIVFRGETDDATSWFCPGVGLARYRYRDPEAGQYENWELLAWRAGSSAQE
jgi:hypothetical protein